LCDRSRARSGSGPASPNSATISWADSRTMTTAQSGSAVRPAATSASLRRCSRARAADSRSALPTSIVPRKIHGSSSNSARPRRDQVHLGLHINGPYPGRNCSRSQHDLERPSIPVSALRRCSGCPNEGNRALRMKTIESATATRLSANAVIGLVSVLSALRILKRASSLGHTYRSIGADNARPPGQDAAAPNDGDACVSSGHAPSSAPRHRHGPGSPNWRLACPAIRMPQPR
jgi:hypothetical protein